MSEERGVLLKLPGAVSDFFLLESQYGHLPSARLFKALDKANRISVGLWVTRGALSPSQSVAFSQKLEEFRNKAGVSDIRSFGVDAHGLGFVALSNLDGVKITSEPADTKEKERRYLMCLRAVARIHDAGVVCGALCSESFFMNRNGVVRFIGVVPALRVRGDTTESELSEYGVYRRASDDSSAPTTVDDVYALLVLGYRMFAGVYPPLEHGPLPPVSSFNELAPAWVDELITPLLAAEGAELPVSASVFLERLKIFKDHQLTAQLAPVLVEPDKSPTREQPAGAVQVKLSTVLGQERDAPESRPIWKRVPSRGQLKALAIGGCVVGVLLVARNLFESFTAHANRQMVLETGPEDVAVDNGAEGSGEQQREQLRKMFASEDPLAHDALLRKLRAVTDPTERDFIIEGITSRSQRMGLVLAADQVRLWKKNLKGAVPEGAAIERLLRIIDPLVPTEPRVEMISALYAEQQGLAARLAMAVALDLGSIESYKPIIARAAKDSAGIEGADERSLFALALVVPELSQTFVDVMRTNFPRIPDADVIWLAKELTIRNAPLAAEMAGILMSRQIVTGPRALFLKELDPSVAAPAPVQMSLVSCAVSGPTRKDVMAFGNWYSVAAVRSLLLAALSTDDPQLSSLAFDALAAKPLADTSVSSIVDIVRASGGIDRAQAARLTAVVGLESKLSDDDISKALTGLNVSGQLGVVIRGILDSKADRVVLELLHQYGPMLGSGLLLEMLKHGRPKVRVSTIEVLGRSGDSVVRKLALDLYLEEKDQDVIAAYERYLKGR